MDEDPEKQTMVEQDFRQAAQIDPKRARFPCCIVWTPLPVLSWFIPFIGHVGICREDGAILDFAGPNFVCVDSFAFGKVTRYVQIEKEKIFGAIRNIGDLQQNGNEAERRISTWDDALRTGTQEYQHRAYSLLTCNCHSFVANNLNRMGYHDSGWNVVNLTLLILFRGEWVSRGSMLRSYLLFIITFFIGFILGGFGFIKFWALFCLIIVGWFVVGSYWFKSLIQL